MGNLILASVFAFQALAILGKFEPGNILATSDANLDRDRLSPRFLKPEMQKVIEEQCAMCYSNLFVSVDALERGGDVAL